MIRRMGRSSRGRASAEEPACPDGVEVSRDRPDKLTVRWPWIRARVWRLFALAVGITAVVLLILDVDSGTVIDTVTFAFLALAVPVALIQRRRLICDGQFLTTEHGPLPFPFDPPIRTPTAAIRGLRVRRGTGKDGGDSMYRLIALRGEDVRGDHLLKGLDQQTARYLKHVIEDFLGLSVASRSDP
jgi:hypothetical protein